MSGKRYRKRQIIPARQAAPAADQGSGIAPRFQAEFFSGPIPPPNLLARYSEVVPNGAERILGMAERQSAHRESLESKNLSENHNAERRGSLYGFIIAMTTILGGLFLIYTGKSVSGLVTILAPLTGLVAVFFYSADKQKKERIEKAAALAERRRR